ncbi:MAG: hypothetical protein HRO68_10240 [Nitrosopumilus sp.]|nr:hypothetical protein [Nitrosopumilus sp.]
MFLKFSRYSKQKIVDAKIDNNKIVKVVTIRKLPKTDGEFLDLKSIDRLDIIAHTKYNNATMFWHIADANTELDSTKLQKKTDESKIIKAPGE